MAVRPFSPLNSIGEIREFDGSAEKLNDFLTLVEEYIAAYNFPVSQGSYVASNMDDRWEFVKADIFAAASAGTYHANYNFEMCFCLLIAERSIREAREWWIIHKEAGGSMPNCWNVAPVGYCALDVIQVSFQDIIIKQFSNPMDRELIMMELDCVHRDPTLESLNSLRTHFSSLFNRAHIHD